MLTVGNTCTGGLDGYLLKWAGLFHYGMAAPGIVLDGSLFPSSFISSVFFFLFSSALFCNNSRPTN